MNSSERELMFKDKATFLFRQGEEIFQWWRATIRKGSTGEDVVYCQQLLKNLGYEIDEYEAHGHFSETTMRAVIEFQKSRSMNPDGVVGPMTWQALQEVAPKTKYYTVTIPHLTKSQINALKLQYSEAIIGEE